MVGIAVVVVVVVVVVGVVVVVWMFIESKDSLNMAMVVTCSVISSSCISYSYIGIGGVVGGGVCGGVGGGVGAGVGAVAEAITGDITVFTLCGPGRPTAMLLKLLLERLDCAEKFEILDIGRRESLRIATGRDCNDDDIILKFIDFSCGPPPRNRFPECTPQFGQSSVFSIDKIKIRSRKKKQSTNST